MAIKISPTIRRFLLDTEYAELIRDIVVAQDKLRAYNVRKTQERFGDFGPVRIDPETGKVRRPNGLLSKGGSAVHP